MPLLLLLASLLLPSRPAAEPAPRGDLARAGCSLEPDLTSYQPGDVALVVATCDAAPAFFRARLGSSHVPFFPLPAPATAADGTSRAGSWRMAALLGLDVGTEPGTAELRWTARLGTATVAAGGASLLTVEPRAFRVQRLRLPSRMVDPASADLARIERERIRMREVLSASGGERLWRGPFLSPVPGGSGAGFGARRVLNGRPSAPHSGLDIAAPEGAPVYASNEGVVVLADTLYYAGRTVVVDHGLGLFTIYSHLSAKSVLPGDRVERGQLLGRVGQTGRVTGPHLHWAVRLNDARVDPLSLMDATAGRNHPAQVPFEAPPRD